MMGEIASQQQLRMSFFRIALVTVPGLLFLGFLSGNSVSAGSDNRWFEALQKPELFPPYWVFPAVWSVLYIMLGIVLAMVIHARGAKGRPMALGLFAVQFLVNLAWTPLFFGAHQVSLALILILVLLILAVATTFAVGKIRKAAAWLMVPYLVWISAASILNFQMDSMNPDAELFVPPTPAAEILL
jgi:translocator protein